ncbi:alanine racemase [Hornefia butyriciproducens]|uniref:alanine racemase n=1 Tax=Hornefia butyriciproducens TaxID=2652293 RepID=UPI0023F08553|nr:alanine racemase [Hornefia butyriciproducens]MDD6300084.1 alanine racemase [Hornefia butyriciproducens]
MKTIGTYRDTIIEIDLQKLYDNFLKIREMNGPDVSVMAVVKADAYGHGAVRVARTLMDAGAAYLAVATLSEAMELRSVYPDYPVFILGHTPDQYLHYVIENHITQTIFSYDQARLLSRYAEKQNTIARVHLKVDTGLHRLGQIPGEAYRQEILRMTKLPNLEIEGIFSHLALTNREENEKQFHSFTDFVRTLEQDGLSFQFKHISDSIACVDYPEYRLNMVRPGSLIYGMHSFHLGYLPVVPAVRFLTRISELHRLQPGEGVSYDYVWRAQRPSIVATLPFGYVDGLFRSIQGKGYVSIHGKKAPLIGVMCMDQCIVDVTDIPDVAPGDLAIILSDGSDGAMTAEEASKLTGTIKNDILVSLGTRPERIYINDPSE